MAKRYTVSSEKLAEVIKLRQAGDSWLGIEKKNVLPRRVAKRAYDEWEKKRSLDEMLKARHDVVVAEFHSHLDALMGLAQSLVRSLTVPPSVSEHRDADSVLGDAWKVNVESILGLYHGEDARAVARKQRQGWKLFEALLNHTRSKVRWEALDEWKEAWNRCIKKLQELKTEATEIMENILNQRKGLKERMVKGSGKDDAIALMTEGILWKVLTCGPCLNSNRPLAWIRTIDERRTQVILDEQDYTHRLTFGDKTLAEEVAKACDWAAQNLSKGRIAGQVTSELNTMRAKSEELEEMLDPLILRPLVLRTHCDLCPV